MTEIATPASALAPMSTGGPGAAAPGLDLVAARPRVVSAPLIRLVLAPGDRPLVSAGEAVLPGTALADRVRDAHQVTSDLPGRDPVRPPVRSGTEGAVTMSPGTGHWWPGEPASAGGLLSGRGRSHRGPGELLYESGGRWRIATGEHHETLESPVAGIVRDARAGVGIVIEAGGLALPGVLAAGVSSRGRLELAVAADGELRAAGLDVARTGAILVVGSRIDAETLTRARAMGVRGVVAAAISSRDLRDLAASERRQRAGLQVTTPFGVLVLDGFVRRPIATPVMAVLAALAGLEVAIATDPPGLVFDPGGVSLPIPPAGWVRVRNGEGAGREGLWLGRVGLRRFAGGVHLEAGIVQFESGPPVAVPLADLERFA